MTTVTSDSGVEGAGVQQLRKERGSLTVEEEQEMLLSKLVLSQGADRGRRSIVGKRKEKVAVIDLLGLFERDIQPRSHRRSVEAETDSLISPYPAVWQRLLVHLRFSSQQESLETPASKV